MNLLPSENLLSPDVLRLLASDLAGRYSLPMRQVVHDSPVDNAYRGTKYADKIEESGEELAKKLFTASFASLKPLSGHIAAELALLSCCSKGDTILVIHARHGGYDGYMPDYIPKMLDLHLKVEFLPFEESRWDLDYERTVDEILEKRPRLVILGASFILFPYNLRWLRGACDDVGAILAYDGSHVLGLIAGGEFQDPLKEGADVLFGSTHKSFFGPQGGIFLTNREVVASRYQEWLFWKTLDNTHLNRIAALTQALLEMQRYGRRYARQIVRNAQSLGRALDDLGFPLKFEELGFTRSHQLLIDEHRLHSSFGLGYNDLAIRLESNNIVIDAVGRLGAAEITRAGGKESDMETIARLLLEAARGRKVKERVTRLRKSLKLSYWRKHPS